MTVSDVVDFLDTVMNIIAFIVMSILAGWTIFKYRKQQKDKLFVISLCMYPFAYFLLAIATLSYLWAKSEQDDDYVYDFIYNYILPFNNLVMWTIELLICFEMQLKRVKLSTDDPIQCQKKIRFWRIFRFVALVISTIFNLLKILENILIDFEQVSQDRIHIKFPDLDTSKQLLFLSRFSMTVFCSLVFAVLIISNLEFFINKFWLSRLEMAGLSPQTTLKSLQKDNFQLHIHLTKAKLSFTYLRMIVWILVLRDAISCSMQLLYVVDYYDSILFFAVNYASRAFLETTIDIVEFVGLCQLFSAQCSFSQTNDEGGTEQVNVFETQGQGYLESEDSDTRYNLKQSRGKSRRKKHNMLSGSNGKFSRGVGSSADNKIDQEDEDSDDFDEAIMIKNKNSVVKNMMKRTASGMEGYNSDEDDEEEDKRRISTIQETENEETSMSEELMPRHAKINIQESPKVNSLAEKVDIFDGRLEQFNKFLEFIVLPKNSVSKRNTKIQNGKSIKLNKGYSIQSYDIQQH